MTQEGGGEGDRKGKERVTQEGGGEGDTGRGRRG